MGTFFKLLFLILAISCIETAGQRRMNCSCYSRSGSRYINWDCGIQNDYSNGEVVKAGQPLKYGHTYKGIGKISTPEECARICHVGDSPKNCYYQFTIELYRTLGGACNLCQPTTNTSLSSDCECILADGVDLSGKMVVNRMYPGPSIQVCLGDMVFVDVKNSVSGSALTIHWHGIYQNGWQHYDGTPFVTQCPITYGSTFRYRWRAQNAGTHFYHGHTGFHQQDGIEGSIIVRVPRSQDAMSAYYDEDGHDTIMYLKDWMHPVAQEHWPGTTIQHINQQPDNILINGKGRWFNTTSRKLTNVPLAVFNLKPNRRYRIRMINMFSWVCSVRLTIENHDLTIIATDGEDVKPTKVTTIVSSAAERYDFVLETNKRVGSYWIQAQLIGSFCLVANLTQVAILRYIGSNIPEARMRRPSSALGLPLGKVLNPLNQLCTGRSPDGVCVKDLYSTQSVPQRIFADRADFSIYLPVFFYFFTPQELFVPYTYKNFEAPQTLPLDNTNLASEISNISNVFPPSPYLTQLHDIPAQTICDYQNRPRTCNNKQPCYCAHLIQHIPLNSLVEIVLVDDARIGINHPFHLHGYGFYVMAQGNLSDVNLTRRNRYDALKLHQRRYGKLNPRPPVKDTLSLASNSYTIVRFIADNPGYWLYHCHFRSHQLSGMEVTLQVGRPKDLPPTPAGFPKCGDFMPPP